jgi:hypothetical protein
MFIVTNVIKCHKNQYGSSSNKVLGCLTTNDGQGCQQQTSRRWHEWYSEVFFYYGCSNSCMLSGTKCSGSLWVSEVCLFYKWAYCDRLGFEYFGRGEMWQVTNKKYKSIGFCSYFMNHDVVLWNLSDVLCTFRYMHAVTFRTHSLSSFVKCCHGSGSLKVRCILKFP